jgi:polar amino acid transport system substrate-binding protein
MSSFTDTKAREKVVNFVDYFEAGTSFFEKASGRPEGDEPREHLRPHRVGRDRHDRAERRHRPGGEVQGLGARSPTRCSPSRRRPRPTSRSRAGARRSAWPTRRSPPTRSSSRTARSSSSARATASAPYGIAVPKADGTLDKAILLALKDLIASGKYAAIMKKWGVAVGRDTHPALNGATS